ncbi:hypothetical protein MtrunA17_Chr2g0327161 [Medicago truncatula]|uniref:Transmembrane protein n=1 Tax=Medicago truncatula TaxID=3880 RepID=A0A396JI21_MEDTR|nr:hypothetical protein MtrunA17_Chr2g0327161 [Medicago truncatula]
MKVMIQSYLRSYISWNKCVLSWHRCPILVHIFSLCYTHSSVCPKYITILPYFFVLPTYSLSLLLVLWGSFIRTIIMHGILLTCRQFIMVVCLYFF